MLNSCSTIGNRFLGEKPPGVGWLAHGVPRAFTAIETHAFRQDVLAFREESLSPLILISGCRKGPRRSMGH